MIVLGSTGSIGVNTLFIAKKFNLNVEVLVAGTNVELLNKQIQEHNPEVVVVAATVDTTTVNHPRVYSGEDAILKVIEESKSELVVNALVGFLGLRPTQKALECNKKVALANKESLVTAGAFLDTSKIQPIDSEHFGLWYLLQDKIINSMTITASGGSFRDWPLEKIKNATLKDALKHPNWAMGQKITIDSASMMNKMFELLEARWLFGSNFTYDAIIEDKSLIHALVTFKDGSTTAHFATANMQLPISYAILEKVEESILEPVDLLKIAQLNFRKIEVERYPIWQIKDALLKEPNAGVIINAANEASIEQFVEGKIGFLDISHNVLDAYEKFTTLPSSIEDVFEIDKEVRNFIKER